VSDENGDLLIDLTDNGEGIPEDIIFKLNNSFLQPALEDDNRESGIGLKNVNRRIKLHFGEGYGIHIKRAQEMGTNVQLRLPKVI